MKRLIPIALFLTLGAACNKNPASPVFENIVIKAMTDGQWAITSFTLNGANITSDFSGYKFQYYSNKTVDAIKNGMVEKTGTWDGNASTMTTSANFPAAANPLLYINGNWNIVNNSWTYVIASQTAGAETKNMRLDKL